MSVQMPPARRVAVCGGRHFDEQKVVWRILKQEHAIEPIGCIITGGCAGAETFAEGWARDNQVHVQTFRADWPIGPEAGGLRNQEIIGKGCPTLVIAFPGGRGTADLVRRAREAGIMVIELQG